MELSWSFGVATATTERQRRHLIDESNALLSLYASRHVLNQKLRWCNTYRLVVHGGYGLVDEKLVLRCDDDGGGISLYTRFGWFGRLGKSEEERPNLPKRDFSLGEFAFHKCVY
jgi:hypothetical protein